MGRDSSDTREVSLNRLKPHHRGMARAQVAFALRPTELAERFGLSLSWISQIINSPLYRAEIERLTMMADANSTAADVSGELKAMTRRAAEVIAEDLYQGERSVHRTNVAFNLLDRTGYHKKEIPVDRRKQKMIFYNFAPLPGDDVKEAERQAEKVREILKSEGGSSDELE